jgi:hypothetical protein
MDDPPDCFFYLAVYDATYQLVSPGKVILGGGAPGLTERADLQPVGQ